MVVSGTHHLHIFFHVGVPDESGRLSVSKIANNCFKEKAKSTTNPNPQLKTHSLPNPKITPPLPLLLNRQPKESLRNPQLPHHKLIIYPRARYDPESPAFDGVLEVACIGIPNDKTTEAVKLFIVKKDPSLSEDKVKAYCRQHLTPYKCPKEIEFRDELPKSNVGKILRKVLRDEEMKKRGA